MKKGKHIVVFLQENLFFISAILLQLSFPFSESLLSITSVFLLIQLFITGNIKQKWQHLKTDRSVLMLSSVYLIYLIGFAFCHDLSTGLYELKKTAFWFLVPMGVALSGKLSEKRFWILLLLLVSFVTVATFITTIKIVFASNFHIRDVRDASFVSHISFAFQIILSFYILLYAFIKQPPVFQKINRWIIVIWCAWLVFFLMLQKSLLGILSFYISAIFFAVWILHLLKENNFRRILTLVFIFLSILPFLYIGYVTTNFYTIKDKMPDENGKYTKQGHKYTFKTDDFQKENGHYVHWYLCKEELAEAWQQRSNLSVDDRDATGYRIYYTLIRYLTSKGLKKDAEGVAALTNQDVENIKNGISNYIFVEKKYSLYPRIYQTIWEIDEYWNTGNPNNQSLSQRFEYVKAAIYIVDHHFWGIGTGNYKLEFANAYEQIDTKLKKEFRFHVHNQYLSYMVKFGWLGLFLILFLVSYAIYLKRQNMSILLVALLVMMITSNFGETIMETHVGLPFFLFFIALFLWYSPATLIRKK